MKKILFILMAVLGLSVSAQEKTDIKQAILHAEKVSTIQTKEMFTALKLDADLVTKVQAILKEKNEMLAKNPDLSDQRKAIVVESTLDKLKKVLSESQYKQLEENVELYVKIKSTDI